MQRFELTDEQYERLLPLLSGKPGDPGRNAEDNRRFVDAVLWIARTDAPWSDLPERFGKYDTVFHRFNRWAKKGRWQTIFEALQDPDLEHLILDSSVVRAHQTVGAKKAPAAPKCSAAAATASRRKSTWFATDRGSRSTSR